MLQIKIVAVGKVREKYLQAGIQEYLKRLKPLARIEIIEVSDESCPEQLAPAEEERVKIREGERILRTLSSQDYVVLLDIRGKELNTPGFAQLLKKLALEGRSNIAFIIGGSLGVAPIIEERADLCWSFSKLTFPHQLMRLIVIEQIYQGFKISREDAFNTIF